jgi:hypothetical protein
VPAICDQKFLLQEFGPAEVVRAFQVFDAVLAGTASYKGIGKDLSLAVDPAPGRRRRNCGRSRSISWMPATMASQDVSAEVSSKNPMFKTF